MTNSEESVSSAHVLIVDDHEELLGVLAFMLWQEGYKVLTARSVSEAVQLLQGHTIDLMVVDWKLPDGSGDLVCQSARRIFPALPILIMSGLSGKEIEDIVSIKPDAYLRKPFEKETLVGIIQHLLETARY